MTLADLQKTIDDSVSNARGFTRELFEKPWNAQQVQDYVNSDGMMSIATLDRDGKPHAAIVAAGCADGVLYIGVTPRTALLGNLRRNQDVAFTMKDKIVGRGTAHPAGLAADLKHVAPSLSEILRASIEQDWEGYFYTVQPDRLFARE